MALVHRDLVFRLDRFGMLGTAPCSRICMRIIALVGDDDGTVLEPVEQCLGASGVMHLARRDQEADRAAFRVDARVDLRGEAASASAHTTISTLFLGPEAC